MTRNVEINVRIQLQFIQGQGTKTSVEEFEDSFQGISKLSKCKLEKAWRTQLPDSTCPGECSAWRQRRRELLSWPIALGILEQAVCLDVHPKSFSEICKIVVLSALSRKPCWRNTADSNYFSTSDASSTVLQQAVKSCVPIQSSQIVRLSLALKAF